MIKAKHIFLFIIGLILDYTLWSYMDSFHSLTIEGIVAFFGYIITIFITVAGAVYIVIDVNNAVNEKMKRTLFQKIYNYIKFLLGMAFIIIGFISMIAGFESNSIIWGIIFAILFFRLGIHFVLTSYKVIKNNRI